MKILFFDTETTGLPKDWNAPLSDLKNWPRLVQLAWQVYDQHQNLIEENDFVIKPNGFTIPIEASNVHKITTEKANQTGENLDKVLQLFYHSVIESNLLVAHNYNYDYSIMGSELLRNGKDNILDKKQNICTMKSSTDFCQIPGPYGYKWPKLEELHSILFNESFNAHNALDDIKATASCFWKLTSLNIIEPIKPERILNTNSTDEKVVELINKSFQKCQIKDFRKFTLEDYRILTDIDSSNSSHEWVKMYKQSLKLRLYPDIDRDKFIVRDLDLNQCERRDIYDEEVPGNDSYDVDFQDPWEDLYMYSVMDQNPEIDYNEIDYHKAGISPFATSTVVLKRDSEGKTAIEINYYKGQEICKKHFLNGILVFYVEYDFNPFQIRHHKKYDKNGKLISSYNIFDINNKLSYYACYGNKGKISSIQIFKNGRIQSIIRYDNFYNIRHLGNYSQHLDYPSLNYIEDILYHDSSLGYIKRNYIFKGDELVIEYGETKIGNKIWDRTSYSKPEVNFGYYLADGLDGMNENESEIFQEICSQHKKSSLICFYIPGKSLPNYDCRGKIRISSLIDLGIEEEPDDLPF